MIITFVVQGVTIGAYAARLAGVQTIRIATSISLFNLFVTAGRLANLFVIFFLGPLSDQAGNAVSRLAGDPAAVAAWPRLRTPAAADRLRRNARDGRFRALLTDVHLPFPARRALVRSPRLGPALADEVVLTGGHRRRAAGPAPSEPCRTAVV